MLISAKINVASLLFTLVAARTVRTDGDSEVDLVVPSVSVGILVRNKAHSLPYFLGHVEALDYPKERMHLYIRVDNTFDSSTQIIRDWLEHVRSLYHRVDFEIDDATGAAPIDPSWTEEHYAHLIKIRQRALNKAHEVWADYFFSLDADVILVNNATLRRLIRASKRLGATVISPMLNCSSSEVYSNFWGDMTAEGYYKRSKNYFEYQRQHIQGVLPVAMVHTAVLVNLNHAAGRKLRFDPPPPNYAGPIDDIIIFARSAQKEGVQFYLDNTVFYGFFPLPLDENEMPKSSRNSPTHWRAMEVDYFVHLLIQAKIDESTTNSVLSSPWLSGHELRASPTPSRVGFDEVYLINLKRRPDRLRKMMFATKQLGISVKLLEAVDGRKLTSDEITRMNITQLAGYTDPYHKRALKFGEIGCFLSHYRIWEDMLAKNYTRILILEDDLRFVPSFTRRLKATVQEADSSQPTWELLYIGRKRMSRDETSVPGTRLLAYPSYTYWTLAYALTSSGAQKLMAQRPLERLIAVDEFLPIMFDRHPNKHWLSQFGPRNLVALSAEPLLVEPTHYTGEPNYISDTEDSVVIPGELCQN